MRKFLLSMMGAAAVIVPTAVLATVASGHAANHAHSSAAKCGTLYTPPCRAPGATIRSIVACQNTGTTLSFPITANSNAGLRQVTVTFGGKAIKTVKYSGGPIKKAFTVLLNTRGFKPGLYSLTVKATDVRGKTVTRVAHFTICTPKPVFTG